MTRLIRALLLIVALGSALTFGRLQAQSPQKITINYPTRSGATWPLFRVSARPADPYREFADAQTIVRFNTRPVAREWTAARPGDLLYFRQDGGRQPDHLMIVVGHSRFDPSASDFVV